MQHVTAGVRGPQASVMTALVSAIASPTSRASCVQSVPPTATTTVVARVVTPVIVMGWARTDKGVTWWVYKNVLWVTEIT